MAGRLSRVIVTFFAIVCVIGTVVFIVTRFTGGSHSLTPYQVEVLSGSTHCSNTGYVEKYRLDGTTSSIFDCLIRGAHRCVTVEGNIATDATLTARLLFAETLNQKRPACLR